MARGSLNRVAVSIPEDAIGDGKALRTGAPRRPQTLSPSPATSLNAPHFPHLTT